MGCPGLGGGGDGREVPLLLGGGRDLDEGTLTRLPGPVDLLEDLAEELVLDAAPPAVVPLHHFLLRTLVEELTESALWGRLGRAVLRGGLCRPAQHRLHDLIKVELVVVVLGNNAEVIEDVDVARLLAGIPPRMNDILILIVAAGLSSFWSRLGVAASLQILHTDPGGRQPWRTLGPGLVDAE